LNPSGGKADWTAIGTPEVDLRSNYCAPDCTRCAEVCPSGAIPQIADREKQTARIGIASVNQAACIRCGACVNVCPYQAITADLGANLPARDAGAIEVLPLN
jgi:formate hydrogenlyase subunit 6/NADH:ubiquinone oxidoreductase subunit I